MNRVVPALALEEETSALAGRLANGPTVAFRYMKENLNRAVAGDMGECLDLEATHHVHTALTEDQLQLLWRLAREPVVCFDGGGA